MRQEAMEPKTFQLIQEMRQAMKKPRITFTQVEMVSPSVLPSEINEPYFTIQETWGGRWEPGILTRSEQ